MASWTPRIPQKRHAELLKGHQHRLTPFELLQLSRLVGTSPLMSRFLRSWTYLLGFVWADRTVWQAESSGHMANPLGAMSGVVEWDATERPARGYGGPTAILAAAKAPDFFSGLARGLARGSEGCRKPRSGSQQGGNHQTSFPPKKRKNKKRKEQKTRALGPQGRGVGGGG